MQNPPDVYRNLREFVGSHSAKLQFPVGSPWYVECMQVIMRFVVCVCVFYIYVHT